MACNKKNTANEINVTLRTIYDETLVFVYVCVCDAALAYGAI